MTAGRNPLAPGTPPTTTPPATLSVRPDGILPELAARRQWVAWRWEHRPGEKKEWAKVPINPRTGNRASVTSSRDWATLTQALTAISCYDCAGIGYVFAADDPYAGVDQDDVRNPISGEIDEAALAVVRRFGSYTEPSVSGTGIHIIVKGKLPPGRRRRDNLETYDGGRFFCFTGQPLPGYDAIRDASADLVTWHAEAIGPLEPERPPTPITSRLDLTDDELLERAYSARNGDKVRRLFDGDLGDYGGDESAADLALVSHLCFWTQDDEQVARIVAASGLYRAKWDREDYRRRTIAKARSRGATYDPTRRQPSTPAASCQDDGTGHEGDDLPDDLPTLKHMIVDLSRRLDASERRATEAERKAAELSLLQSRTMAAFRSRNLGNEKATGVALAHLTASQGPTKADPDGWLPVPHKRLADGAGVSDQTVPNHLEKLERGVGGFERKVQWVPQHVDESTGEIVPGHKQTFIRMTVPPAEFLERIATANPNPSKPKNGWGGRHDIEPCPDHPGAKIVKRTSYHCKECNRCLGADPDVEMEVPCGHLDGTVPEPAGAPPLPDTRHPAPPRASVDNHYRSANGPASHNASSEPAPAGSIAAAWQAGQALPGFDPPSPRTPLDPRTDVAHGRASP